jgi:glucan phosphoethanolaminetransferase (alkaline phosphatase superfamily)
MTFLDKIRNQPESRRKIILWSIMIVMGLALFFVFLKSAQKNLKRFESSNFGAMIKMPDFSQALKSLPDLSNDENFKKLEQEIEKINKDGETQSTTTE